MRREERSEERHEFYNGIIAKLPMAGTPHQLICTNLIYELESAFRKDDKTFNVLSNGQLVYLPELNFTLYPDVLVVSEKLVHQDTNQVLLINPILIIEVLSRSTGKYDKTQKFDEYKTLDSFKEYVLINQNKYSVETRFRIKPDTWREKRYTELTDSVVLNSVGCSIAMDMIYRKIVLK